jgi:hypothetical protein
VPDDSVLLKLKIAKSKLGGIVNHLHICSRGAGDIRWNKVDEAESVQISL